MPWKDIQNTLQRTPGSIVAPWEFPSSLDAYLEPPGADNAIELQAAKLFIQFTQTWWAVCQDDSKQNARQERRITTLEEAVEFWSLARLWDTIKIVEVRALQKGTDESFGERVRMWFRPAEDSRKLRGKWAWFLDSYMTSYRKAVEALKKLSTVPATGPTVHTEVHRLDDALQAILSTIQCLPDADERSPCKADTDSGAVALILNPSALMVRGKTTGRPKRTAPPAMNTKHAFLINLHKAEVPMTDEATRHRAVREFIRKTRQFAAQQRGGKQWKRGRGGRGGRPGRPRGRGAAPQVDVDMDDVDEVVGTTSEETGDEDEDDEEDKDEHSTDDDGSQGSAEDNVSM